ncbi:MAG TPA: amidohydrolase family protein, partial [Candidatus Cloacimonadota bacterium]|nr:amidohydrolase family protein [Candidatus Cloacimonadota bacterium]
MQIKVRSRVRNADEIVSNDVIRLQSSFLKKAGQTLDRSDLIAYPPFINCHDHLISDWYPKAGDGKPYQNVSKWVIEMRSTPSFLERNRIWLNDGKFDLTKGNAPLIVRLGMYKNLFSGCVVVQDHISKQKDDYYQNNPITILKDYTQCHSLEMGNWWGGDDPVSEWKKTDGRMPFIIHLGEGTDDSARKCFPLLEQMDLLKPNTMIIHGIALSRAELKKCAEHDTTICWCPESNFFLIGQTLDIESCLEFGVNVVIGTDSTMSGGINLLSEIQTVHHKFPHFPLKDIFRMITANAAKALFLPDSYAELRSETENLLLLRHNHDDVFENILQTS